MSDFEKLAEEIWFYGDYTFGFCVVQWEMGCVQW